ncbi:MAG: OmpA family protein [Bacteroidota bacterium]
MPKLNKLSFFIIIFFACTFIGAWGQTNMNPGDEVEAPRRLSRARKAFEDMAYPKAIRRYERLQEKDLLPDSEKQFLALAYLKILEPEKAEEIYSSIAKKNLKGEHLYNYAKALKYNGKYARADSIMALYDSEKPKDSRARLQQDSRSFADSIMKQKRHEIEEVGFNSEYADFAPFMQGGYLYFSSEREINLVIDRETAREKKPYLNIFRVGKKEGRFKEPEQFIPDFRTIFHDGPLCFNLYGNEVFITRNTYHSLFKKEGKDGSNHLKIVYAHRQPDGAWSKPEELPFNDDSYSCGHPFLTKDGSRLYFVSNMPGGMGNSDIYYADRNEDTWEEPVNLGEKINTEGNEMFPFIDENERLYFASDGHQGLGGLDIFVAEKTDGEYVVKNIGHPVNSRNDDFSLFLQPDAKHGFFASNRPGGTGSDDIYRVEIIEPVTFAAPTKESTPKKKKADKQKGKAYNGQLINRKSREPVPNAIIGLIDDSDAYLMEVTTNKQGIFKIPDSISGQITAFTSVDHFFPREQDFYLESMEDTILFELKPKPYYGVTGKVTRAGNNEPIPDATILIYSESFDTDTTHTNKDGTMKARLNPYTHYQIAFHKPRYIPRVISYSTMQIDTGLVNLNQLMNLRMEEAMPGSTFELNVTYDDNEVSIQEEGVNALDHLVHFLRNNPDTKIEVGVHTDSRGDANTNMNNSQKRAESAVQYLTEKGVDASRLTSRGYGESRLKNNCADGVPCSEEEHQENERTEITVLE